MATLSLTCVSFYESVKRCFYEPSSILQCLLHPNLFSNEPVPSTHLAIHFLFVFQGLDSSARRSFRPQVPETEGNSGL